MAQASRRKIQAVINKFNEVLKTRNLAKFIEYLNSGEIDICILVNHSTPIIDLVEKNAVTILNFILSLEDELKEEGCDLKKALGDFESMIYPGIMDDYFINGLEAFEIMLEKMPNYVFRRQYEFVEETINMDDGGKDIYGYEYNYYTLEQLALEYSRPEILDIIRKEMKKRGMKVDG